MEAVAIQFKNNTLWAWSQNFQVKFVTSRIHLSRWHFASETLLVEHEIVLITEQSGASMPSGIQG